MPAVDQAAYSKAVPGAGGPWGSWLDGAQYRYALLKQHHELCRVTANPEEQEAEQQLLADDACALTARAGGGGGASSGSESAHTSERGTDEASGGDGGGASFQDVLGALGGRGGGLTAEERREQARLARGQCDEPARLPLGRTRGRRIAFSCDMLMARCDEGGDGGRVWRCLTCEDECDLKALTEKPWGLFQRR